MPISVQCPACQKQFHIKDEFANRVGRCTGCKATFTMTPLTAVKAAPGTAPKKSDSGTTSVPMIGRFQIRKKLGAGAFGTVYRAFDPQLEREVALKVPQAGVLNSPQRVERFLREAKASAQLTHPGIVPVYDAGTDGGRHYIAAAFIEGQPLADAIDDGGMEPQRAAKIIADLGDALFYAHMLGVVHRDIKPANIMLDGDDRPHLMDFGLAAWENSTEKLTHDGAVLGTPTYMAPEQAEGKNGEARMESDQYSLGVVLYELLTGRTPFEGPPQVVIHNVINKEPPRPTSLRKGLPRDLETICLKAMAKRVKDRYTSCQALARDLRRWLDGEPIQARRLGVVERGVRWAKKEPMMAGATCVILLLLSTVAGLLTWKVGALANDVAAEQRQKNAALAASEKAAAELASEVNEHDITRKGSYGSQINFIDSRMAGGDLMAPYDFLPQIKPELRGWEWNHLMLAGEGLPAAVRIFGNRNSVLSVAFNVKSTQLICANVGGIVQVHDLFTGKQVRDFELPGGWQQWMNARMALSGDGERLVTVRHDMMAPPHLFGPAMPAMPAPVAPQNPNAKDVKPADEAAVWDVRTGKRLFALKATIQPGPALVAVNHDGSRIALANGDKYELSLYDGKTGERLHVLEGACTLIKSLTFGPPNGTTGELLFAVDGGDSTRYEDRIGTHSVKIPITFEETVDGKTVRKTKYETRQEQYTYRVEIPIQLPPSIKTWEVSGGAAKTPLASRPSTREIALSHDGQLGVLLGSSQQTIARPVSERAMKEVVVTKEKVVKGEKVKYQVKVPVVYEVTKMVSMMVEGGDTFGLLLDSVPSGEEVGVWADAVGVQAVAFSLDGGRVATASSDGCRTRPRVQLWDAKTRTRILTLRLPDDVFFLNVTHLVWSPDSMHLAGWGQDGRVIVWSAMSGRSIAHRNDLGPVNTVVWSADGNKLAALSDCSNKGVVIEPTTGKTAFAFSALGVNGQGGNQGGGCIGLAFAGQQLVRTGRASPGGHGCYGMMDIGAVRWNSGSGQSIAPPAKAERVVAVSSDGSRIVTIDSPAGMPMTDAPAVRVADTGAEVCKLENVPTPIDRAEFSPNGKYLAIASANFNPENGQQTRLLRVWDTTTGKVLFTQDKAAGVFAFRPDSGQIASASELYVPRQFMPPGVEPTRPTPGPAPMPTPPKEVRAPSKIASRFGNMWALFQPDSPKGDAPKTDVPKVVPGDPAPPPKTPIEPPTMPEVTIFSLTTGKAVQVLKGFDVDVRRMEYSPSGKQLAIASYGLRVVELPGDKIVLNATDADGPFAFTPRGDRLVYVAKPPSPGVPQMMPPMPAPVAPSQVNAADEEMFQPVVAEFQPKKKNEPADQVPPDPDVEMIQPGVPAPFCDPGMAPAASVVKFWDTAKHSEVASHHMQGNPTALTHTRTGDLVAVATLPATPTAFSYCGPPTRSPTEQPPQLHILGAVDGKLLAAIHGHTDRIHCLAFDPAGQRLATASEDGTMRIWMLGALAGEKK